MFPEKLKVNRVEKDNKRVFSVEKTKYNHIFLIENENSIFLSMHFDAINKVFKRVDTGDALKMEELVEYIQDLKNEFGVEKVIISSCGPSFAKKSFPFDRIDNIEFAGSWDGETQTKYNSVINTITVKEI